MKRFKKVPLDLVRVSIKTQDTEAIYLSLVDCTLDSAHDKLKKLMEKQKISPIIDGRSTNIILREVKGATYGKSKSFSVRGLTPEEVRGIIENTVPETAN